MIAGSAAKRAGDRFGPHEHAVGMPGAGCKAKLRVQRAAGVGGGVNDNRTHSWAGVGSVEDPSERVHDKNLA